jgi:hypothetical protein
MKRYSQWILSALVTAAIGLCQHNGAWAAEDKDACAMLQKANVEAAFSARTFDTGTPSFAVKGSKSMAAVSSCTYTSKGASRKDTVTVGLNVRLAPSDATATTPEAAKAGAIQLKGTPVDVAGLGQGAYWGSMVRGIQLNVFRGKREWLIFGSTAKTMDNDSVLAALTKIAQTTLAR